MTGRLRAFPDGVFALAAVLGATAPVWRVGWLRDDWLLLWQALDPATAPANAEGYFPRPVAAWLWNISVWLGGDATWPMHLLMVLAWTALVLGALRWHRSFGGGNGGAAVTALALALHGALVEPRVWAAGSNGVLAAALAVWGAWLLHAGPTRARRAAGLVLLVLAVLSRADAVVLLVLLAAAGRRPGRAVWPVLLGVAAAGALALVWMVTVGGNWGVDPAAGGRLLRLLLLPWGPPLPARAQAVLAVVGVIAALGAGRLLLTAAPRTAAFLLAAGAVTAAGCVAGWIPAGRYVLMPAVLEALVLGSWWDGAVRENLAGRPARLLRGCLAAWLVVSAAAAVDGRTLTDLTARSLAETGLYRAVRASLPLPGDRLTVLNPPAAFGWDQTVGDYENVVGTAARRQVAVVLGRGDAHAVDFPAAVWRHGAWTVWTGREIQGATPETR